MTILNSKVTILLYDYYKKYSTPGPFIVHFKNETTLLVLWQPPYPSGYFTDYKVSIWPKDAVLSEIYVPRDKEQAGSAAFNGLVPGRVYNVSVQTYSEAQLSDNTTAVYRTVPLRPGNVTFDSIRTDSFTVRWSGPSGITEFTSNIFNSLNTHLCDQGCCYIVLINCNCKTSC